MMLVLARKKEIQYVYHVCLLKILSDRVRVAKIRSAGRMRPADQFNSAHQIPCTLFSSTTFPTVESSATALAPACLLLPCLPQQHSAGSSPIKV